MAGSTGRGVGGNGWMEVATMTEDRPGDGRDWELAPVDEWRATRMGTHLVVVARGVNPHGGYETKLRPGRDRALPPPFEVVRWADPNGTHIEVLTPFEVVHIEGPDNQTTSIRAIDAGGTQVIEVIEVPASTPTQAVLVTGSSGLHSFSLEEAIGDALSHAPPVQIADWMEVFEVVSISGKSGGIAGLSQLDVTLRLQRPAT